jgi:DNA-binding transcriptional LysR family regulator
MDLAALHAFAAVVREGSFTAAARALGVSKQTVSDRVAALEQEIGVKLLTRTTRRVTPTTAGASYVARVSALLAGLDEAGRALQAEQREPAGVLRVSAPALYGRRFSARGDGGVHGPSPGGAVRAVALRPIRPSARRGVRRGDSGRPRGRHDAHGAAAGHVARSLCGQPGISQGPRRAVARAGPRARARCIVVRAGESWEVEGATVRVASALVVNDLEVARDAAVRGVGIARLPNFLCDDLIRAGALRVLFDDGPGSERPVWALYADGSHAPAKVRRFIEVLLASPGINPPR